MWFISKMEYEYPKTKNSPVHIFTFFKLGSQNSTIYFKSFKNIQKKFKNFFGKAD